MALHHWSTSLSASASLLLSKHLSPLPKELTILCWAAWPLQNVWVDCWNRAAFWVNGLFQHNFTHGHGSCVVSQARFMWKAYSLVTVQVPWNFSMQWRLQDGFLRTTGNAIFYFKKVPLWSLGQLKCALCSHNVTITALKKNNFCSTIGKP